LPKLHFGFQLARSNRKSLISSTLTVVLCVAVAFVPSVLAQKNTSKSTRKLVSEVKPVYPPTLKSMHIEGLVRLTAIVLPNGSVVAVEVRGGNPILVENAVKAVKAWKYAPAPAQTEEEVVLDFK
jgi:TonB family protein